MSLDQLDPSRERQRGPSAGEPLTGGRSVRRQVVTALAGVLSLVLLLLVALQLNGGIRPAVQRIVADRSVVPAEDAMLADLWSSYKDDFLEQGTSRTLDPAMDDITTSEGESYTMMRAAWMDDRATFDASWTWTKDNLQRPDRLISWKFGERADGTYGVLDDAGGQNAASDADVDIAYALLMAYSRWADDDYLYDALPLIQAVWDLEVVQVAGQPVLTANDLERQNAESVLVNPSYFAPYAYRAFAAVDPANGWAALVDNSYAVLDEVSAQPLGGVEASGLVPDWVRLDRATGAVSAATDVVPTQGTSSDYGFEALRTPWRLALDARWHGDARAQALLERQASVLGDAWSNTGGLAAVYGHDGTPAVDYPSIAMYGGAMGALDAARPVLAREVYRSELLPLYDADRRSATAGTGYYDANWAWFGMALHLDRLPDLNDPQGSDLP